MRRFLRNNGLSIALFGLFLVCLLGQSLAGQRAYNDQQKQHGGSPVSFPAYLISGHSIEAIFENWESEFLQVLVGVLLSVFLFQKGSSQSKPPREGTGEGEPPKPPPPDAPWPVRRGGWVRWVYANSLSIALGVLFLLSFALHALGGMWEYNQEQVEHGAERVSYLGFLGTSEFWFQSFQNYQSEFLALFVMVVLTIVLRQRGSPESKPVEAPHGTTGD